MVQLECRGLYSIISDLQPNVGQRADITFAYRLATDVSVTNSKDIILKTDVTVT